MAQNDRAYPGLQGYRSGSVSDPAHTRIYPAPIPNIEDANRRISRAQSRSEFRLELERVINRYSMEHESGTQDFVLATYLMACLSAYETAVTERDRLLR
jgi:hypothetical protein